MPSTTTCHPAERLIATSFHGNVVVKDLPQKIAEHVALTMEHNYTRWLVDFSQADLGAISILQMANLPDLFRRLAVPLKESMYMIRHAIVIPPNRAELKFLETVSVNRAIPLRVFESLDEAKSWLLLP